MKRLVLVPEEAKVVTLIFKKKAEGLSDYQLTRFLQQGCAEGKNWRTKTGKHWTAVQVKRVWQNPLYTGNIKVKDKKNKGEYRILLGNHQGIVSEEEFLGLNLGMKGLFSEEKA